MSKEKTLTAEEIEEAMNFMLMPEHSSKSLPLLMALFAKQYAQAKVLEALKPQKELIEELLTIFDGNGVPNVTYVINLINDYYETEVKPKYK